MREMKLAAILAASWLATSVTGLFLDLPRRTPTPVAPKDNGWTPRTTQGPSLRMSVFARQNGGNLAYSGTCGFKKGELTEPIVCQDNKCMFYDPGSAGGPKLLGCCSRTASEGQYMDDCAFRRTCIDYAAYIRHECSSECASDTYVLQCTDPKSPFCLSWTLPADNVKAFACSDDQASTWTTLLPTASAVNGSAFTATPVVLPPDQLTGWSNVYPWEKDLATSPTPGNSTGPGNNTKTSSNGGHSNTGAIVGGAIGGFLALALVVGAAVWLLLRHRRQKAAKDSQYSGVSQDNSAYNPHNGSMNYPSPAYNAADARHTSYQFGPNHGAPTSDMSTVNGGYPAYNPAFAGYYNSKAGSTSGASGHHPAATGPNYDPSEAAKFASSSPPFESNNGLTFANFNDAPISEADGTPRPPAELATSPEEDTLPKDSPALSTAAASDPHRSPQPSSYGLHPGLVRHEAPSNEDLYADARRS